MNVSVVDPGLLAVIEYSMSVVELAVPLWDGRMNGLSAAGRACSVCTTAGPGVVRVLSVVIVHGSVCACAVEVATRAQIVMSRSRPIVISYSNSTPVLWRDNTPPPTPGRSQFGQHVEPTASSTLIPQWAGWPSLWRDRDAQCLGGSPLVTCLMREPGATPKPRDWRRAETTSVSCRSRRPCS